MLETCGRRGGGTRDPRRALPRSWANLANLVSLTLHKGIAGRVSRRQIVLPARSRVR